MTSEEEEGEHVFWCILSLPCDLNIQSDYKTDVNMQILAFPGQLRRALKPNHPLLQYSLPRPPTCKG